MKKISIAILLVVFFNVSNAYDQDKMLNSINEHLCDSKTNHYWFERDFTKEDWQELLAEAKSGASPINSKMITNPFHLATTLVSFKNNKAYCCFKAGRINYAKDGGYEVTIHNGKYLEKSDVVNEDTTKKDNDTCYEPFQ